MRKLLFFSFIAFSLQTFAAQPISDIDWDAMNGKFSQEIYPFTTDGCTRFLDGWGKNANWLNCCEIHDIAYWSGLGGNPARIYADRELRSCVSQKANAAFGTIVWTGVKIAKPVNTTTLLPTTYRWGYGWPYVLTGKGILTAKQIDSVKEMANTIIPSIEENRRQRGYPPMTDEEKMAAEAKIILIRNY